MGFSVPRRARLPETNHIMWIVFVIHFQSSPLLGRVPEDLLPLHYYVSCIHVLGNKNWGNTKSLCGSHSRPSRFVLHSSFQSFALLALFLILHPTTTSLDLLLLFGLPSLMLFTHSPKTKDLVQICFVRSAHWESPQRHTILWNWISRWNHTTFSCARKKHPRQKNTAVQWPHSDKAYCNLWNK